MKAESVRKSNYWIGIAVSLYVITFLSMGLASAFHSTAIASVVPAAWLIGLITLIIGCMHYAQAKGYSGALGALAVFGLIGLLILYAMPDKCPEPAPVPTEEIQDKAA